ncbi:hypothetical protein RBU61_08505 [Tissierella sp. MB52-C2]|uniref:hypothetical protein n=1 Tax=Tissierella sp. MB52-C2 TaxID=3070999 RepID=UPI00280BA837|nr:hypothetical protein [Tissierella sp. MB52-C2]WMM26706.1 hypothetical protein RBU61_08505 [Tissierella sp. MB52-C2]
MDKFWELLINAIKNGDYDLISIILLLFISIWLYNEFRKSYIANKSEDKLDIEKALEQYSKLYFGIAAFQSKNIDSIELIEYINQAIVYFPKKVAKQILELDKNDLNPNSPKIEEIRQTAKNEINSLKLKQRTISVFDYGEDIFEQISWFISKNNFDSFIQPFIYFTFTLIGIIFLLSIAITIRRLSGFSKIALIAFLINSLLSTFIMMQLSQLMLNKNVKAEFYKYFLFLIAIPFSITLLLLKYPVIRGVPIIINTITIIIFVYLANKGAFTTPKNK